MVSDDIKHEVKKLHIVKKIRELRKKGGWCFAISLIGQDSPRLYPLKDPQL